MNVVFFITSLSSGGAEHQLSILSNLLCRKNYEITIVTISDYPDHYLLDSSVSRVCLAYGKSKFCKICALWKYFLMVKADVVMGFGVRESFQVSIPLLFRRKVKFVAGERNTTQKNPPYYEVLCHKYLFGRAKSVVSNSYTQTEYLRENYPKLACKLYTIINFTDVHEYRPKPMPAHSGIRVGIVCRYESQKNFIRFIDVINQLYHDCPQIHFDWYGNMNFSNEKLSHYYESGVEKIKHLGLDEAITLHDKIDNVADLIPTFDVMCLPSLYEGFSNSISEYICCGRPVLCSDVSDNGVMVHDGENGYVFNPRDVDDMVAAFKKFYLLPENERYEMGLRSRILAERLFDRDKFINDYINIIGES